MRSSVLLLFASLIMFAPTALTAQSSARSALPSEATLSPGDAVRITVWRKPELSGEFQVSGDGSLADPFYMEVRVAGLPISTVTSSIQSHLARYETEPRVLVEPLYRVSVGGQVRQPNLYSLRPETTVAQAVMLAGGPLENARLDRVRLLRDGQDHTVDLSRPNVGMAQAPIRSGDQILVARRVSVIRDYVGPISSVTSAVVSIAYIVTRYF